MDLELLDENRCFGGSVLRFRHLSQQVGLPMNFSVFLPPAAKRGPVPALIWLAGLTCNEQTFMVKAGAQRVASELGVALVAPDTSPRGAGIPGEEENWDFGIGAGFYLDATQAGWSKNYRMESWLMVELLPLLSTQFAIDSQRVGIFGHSMGGHGALVLALRHPGLFKTLSAFAPISAPADCPWGKKAFSGYLGGDIDAWREHDATCLMRLCASAPYPGGILIDQGMDDKFLTEQLRPELLEAACRAVDQPLTLRRHDGYDHGYYFVASFMEDHLRFHANALG